MNRKSKVDTERLRDSLRDWDPVNDGNELDGVDRARMRRRVLNATVEPVRLGFPVRAMAVAAVVILAVALGWGIYDDAVMQPPAGTPTGPAAHGTPVAGPGEEAKREARQIQFSTPGGTRVVWTLDPDFEV